jgi:hypothetical protein
MSRAAAKRVEGRHLAPKAFLVGCWSQGMRYMRGMSIAGYQKCDADARVQMKETVHSLPA